MHETVLAYSMVELFMYIYTTLSLVYIFTKIYCRYSCIIICYNIKTLCIRYYFEGNWTIWCRILLWRKKLYSHLLPLFARLPFKSVNYVAPCCVVSKLMINRKNETEKIGFRLGLSIGHHISIINILHDITNLIYWIHS